MALIQQTAAYTRMFNLLATGLTAAITISKAGGAFANPAAGVSNLQEVSGGWYSFNLQGGDTDTLGDLAYSFSTGTMDATFVDQIVAFAPTDGTRLGLSSLPTASAGSSGGLPLVNSQIPTASAGNVGGLTVLGSNGCVPADVFVIDGSTLNAIPDALLDRVNGIESGCTPRQALRLLLSAMAAKVSISSNTVTFRDINDTKNRIVATTDSTGQRTAVTLTTS